MVAFRAVRRWVPPLVLALGGAPTASADLLIDDFTTGPYSSGIVGIPGGSWRDARGVSSIHDQPDMFGGRRRVSLGGSMSQEPSFLELEVGGGQVMARTQDVSSAILNLTYGQGDTSGSELDLSSESALELWLGDGTTEGHVHVWMIDVDPRQGSGNSYPTAEMAYAGREYSGSGILRFDFEDMLSASKRPVDPGAFDMLVVIFERPLSVDGGFWDAIITEQITGDEWQVNLNRVQAVPEPGTLIALGLGSLIAVSRRRRKGEVH